MSVPVGAHAHLKVPGIVTDMIAGADCIDDLDVLRHGGMGELFGVIRTASIHARLATARIRLGQRAPAGDRVAQLLAAATPVLADVNVMTKGYRIHIDSTQRRIYAHA